jgi:hypothetical protein
MKEFKPKMVYDRDLRMFRLVTLVAILVDAASAVFGVWLHHNWLNAALTLLYIGNMLIIRYMLSSMMQSSRDNLRLVSAMLAERTREEEEH